jgi:peptidoglycan/xylan/chitin deacetylase (PgdA/CDA1 family)
MCRVVRILTGILFFALCFSAPPARADASIGVPVLVYHRFGATVADSMTVTDKVFASQLQWLRDNGYTVIPLRTLVNYLRGEGPAPPPKSVVITADDAHKTVYTDMFPLVRRYRVPVTLFIYPSAVSNASYAMTWEELQELKKTGLFDMESHTYWHPNFKQEKKKLSPDAYRKLVTTQLKRSREVLEKRLGTGVDLLAWPFGIYDEELEKAAAGAGYVAAFSIDGRNDAVAEKIMAQPRYLMVNGDNLKKFAVIIQGRAGGKGRRSFRRG